MCRLDYWSVRTLRQHLDTMLYERTAVSRKSAAEIGQDLAALRDTGQLSPDLVFRDTYVLDFLGLPRPHGEATLEQAIVGQLQEFILEMGEGLSFIARQKRISVDDTDYYLDLLFYHRRLRRLVAIDLKIGKFKPAYKGPLRAPAGRGAAHRPATVQRRQHRAHRAAAARPAPRRHPRGPVPDRAAPKPGSSKSCTGPSKWRGRGWVPNYLRRNSAGQPGR